MTMPSSLRTLLPTEAAWLGAMLDGEGHISFVVKHKTPHVVISNTEVELVATALRITQAGSISTREQNGLGTKRMWEWTLHRSSEVPALLAQLQPYSLKAQLCVSPSSGRGPSAAP